VEEKLAQINDPNFKTNFGDYWQWVPPNLTSKRRKNGLIFLIFYSEIIVYDEEKLFP
jgi:hypothetical protein